MLTRREFVAQLAAAGVAATALPYRVGAPLTGARSPVVSIHMDQPYVDVTGRAVPYLPPVGLRGAAPVANLSETEFRSCFMYL